MVGQSDTLAAALDALPDGIEADVLRTGAYARANGPTLSDRQREAVRAAWRVGYYELPREGDLAAVAARLDCSSSTASDLLRRAERRLVRATLDVASR